MQGAKGDNFYIIDEGRCDVWVQKGSKPPFMAITLGPGNAFGELALMCPSLPSPPLPSLRSEDLTRTHARTHLPPPAPRAHRTRTQASKERK